MKNARMNISHSRFILFNLKIFGDIVRTDTLLVKNKVVAYDSVVENT